MTEASLTHVQWKNAGPLGVDTAVTLDVNGTEQRVRLCAARTGLPPVLIVQAGPGVPLLNEVAKFQQRLGLEHSFSVAYWDQRGCGSAARQDAQGVSLATQRDDARTVIRWVAGRTRQRVVVLGISLGATIALQAAVEEAEVMKALVAVSIDTDIPASDVAVQAFLEEASSHAGGQRLRRSLEKLGPPPYTDPAPFQLRARMLADLGGIEHGRRFGGLLRSLLFSLIRTYGWFGAAAALRNMNAVQRRLLPELATMNLFANWPRPAVPVHYVFGNKDPLVPYSLVQRISGALAHGDTVARVPDAGHMVHFDAPATVRSLIAQAHTNR